MNFLTSKEICEQLKITKTTLMNWKNKNKISFKKLSPKKILYDIDSFKFIEFIKEDK